MRALIALFMSVVLLMPLTVKAEGELVYVQMETSMGDIYLALNKGKAPETVENFLAYANSGYFNRLIFHRVVPGRLIQGGGYNRSLYERVRRESILNEADNGLENLRGTIAMARNDDPHSAQSQFYINLKDNPELNHAGTEYNYQWGYAVFGEVIAGMAVADAIGEVPTEGRGEFTAEVPVENIFINAIREIAAEDVLIE